MAHVPVRPPPAKGGGADPPAALVRVPFHGEEVDVLLEDGRAFVPIRPRCDALGLNLSGQLQRLRRAPWASVCVMHTQMPGDDQVRPIACVDLDALPMWLATIDAGRVRADLRERLELYQREIARVVRDAVFPRHQLEPAPPPPPALPPPRGGRPPREPARRLETVERVLGYVEEDIAHAFRIDRRTPATWATLRLGIHTGLTWAAWAIGGAEYARDEPGIGARIDAARAHQRRLGGAADRL